MQIYASFRANVMKAGFVFFMISIILPASGRVFTNEFWMKEADAKKEVEYIMSIPEKEMLALVPRESGGMFQTACPQCPLVITAGAGDNCDFTWDPRKPGQIKCKHCGNVYPNNEKYPDDKYLEIETPQGMRRLYYYERPENDRIRHSPRIFFRLRAQWEAKIYLERQACLLAELWRLTGRDEYARRSALIMLEFAKYYPGYVIKHDIRGEKKEFLSYKNIGKYPWSWYTSRWSWLSFLEISESLLRAYDALEGWKGWDGLGEAEARERIVRDLLSAQVDFAIGCPPTYYNMEPYGWRNMISAGRILNRPDWIHEVMWRVDQYMTRFFLYDCSWWEPTPSYASQNKGGLSIIADRIKGYSDPDGYTGVKDGGHFENMDFKKEYPRFERFLNMLDACRFPNGRYVPVNDTWAQYDVLKEEDAWKRARTKLFPGMGLATLKSGEGTNAFYSYLNFTICGYHGKVSINGHKHWDNLSMGLYANGDELLSDIGYTHTIYRRWANSTMSHNTVAVNGTESTQTGADVDNHLRDFAAGPGFQVASAENSGSYTGVTSLYRRTLAQVGENSSDAYLIDVFEVKGGQRHDYLLHGSADEAMDAKVIGADMKEYGGMLLNEGVKFERPPKDKDGLAGGLESGYGFVSKLREGLAASSRGVVLDMRFKQRLDEGVRSYVFVDGEAKVYLGEAPSIRRTLGKVWGAEDNTKLDDYQAPFFCLRHDGADLKSTFVAAHEAVKGPAKIKAVKVIRSRTGLVVVVDSEEGRRDYFVMAADNGKEVSVKTSDGQLQMRGRYGLMRLEGGRVQRAYTVGDESQREAQIALTPRFWQRLTRDKYELTGRSVCVGLIKSASDKIEGESFGSFEAVETLDAGDYPLLLLQFPDRSVRGYNVERIGKLKDGSRIYVKERTGFEMHPDKNQIAFTCYPIETIEGAKVEYKLVKMVSKKQ